MQAHDVKLVAQDDFDDEENYLGTRMCFIGGNGVY